MEGKYTSKREIPYGTFSDGVGVIMLNAVEYTKRCNVLIVFN